MCVDMTALDVCAYGSLGCFWCARSLFACAACVCLLWCADKILSKFGEGEHSRAQQALQRSLGAAHMVIQHSMLKAQLHSKRMQTERLQNSRLLPEGARV